MANNDEDSDQDVEDFSDPNVDEVPDDIDDEGPEEVEDVHGPSFNSDVSEFPEYVDIIPAHRLAVNSQFEIGHVSVIGNPITEKFRVAKFMFVN
ncbi:hypothetical protein GOBAR_AA33010 [Gossypium barbadense]|uniref:Uncharacterized protein n=1 Tax=Gossypium barbadense TaxID=3634 RepID=A0A2P5W9E5_GOSBA|nr:hypothetical protein GOBAR_AA33010 [Gossypium barbadense]